MKYIKKFLSRSALRIILVLGILIVVGSFADLGISRLLYPGHENSIGQMLAAFGELPAFLALTCSGALLIVYRDRIQPKAGLISAAAGVVLILIGIALTVSEAVNSVPALPVGVALLVALFAAAASGIAILMFARGTSARMVLRFALTVCFVSAVSLIVIRIVKLPWARVRMWLIVQSGNESYFMPWWQTGSELKNQLMAEGVPAEAFKSFPSGHTGCASCAMLLALLPTLNKRWLKKPGRFLAVGCLWTVIVAVSRICMGAHFLTDTAFACLITVLVAVLGVYLFYFSRTFDWAWRLATDMELPAFARKLVKTEQNPSGESDSQEE